MEKAIVLAAMWIAIGIIGHKDFGAGILLAIVGALTTAHIYS